MWVLILQNLHVLHRSNLLTTISTIKSFHYTEGNKGRSSTQFLTKAKFGSEVQNTLVNSLAPGRSWCDFKNTFFNLALLIGIFKTSCGNVLSWMSQDLTDDKSTLVQVMAWCHQAARHYLNQCWRRSPTPYGVTRSQWVKVPIVLQGWLTLAFKVKHNLKIQIWLISGLIQPPE